MSFPIDSLYDVVREFKDISGRNRSDLALVLETVVLKLDTVLTEIALLRKEVQKMSNRIALDQAVNDLDAAVTAKLTADATLDPQAAAGRSEEADTAKVEDLVAKLNAETAAENAANAPSATPAPATPAPTQNVTVTGQTASGTPVVDAPVATGPAAPTTQTVPAGTTN